MINIVLCTDDAYAPYAAVVMASAIANTDQPAQLRFFVLTPGMSQPLMHNLRNSVERAGAVIDIVKADVPEFNELESGRFGPAALLRLFMHHYLPLECERAIYLDCDVLVRDDLADLWSTPLDDHVVAAAMNLSSSPKIGSGLEMEPDDYFNSGVMLVDLKAWRSQQIAELAVSCLKDKGRKFRYPDQDALNAVLTGKWYRLGPQWNFQPAAYAAVEKRYPHLLAYLPALEKAIRHPSIVHFIGAVKPWHGGCVHPLQGEFFAYSRLTPWPLSRRDIRSQLSWVQRLRLAGKWFKIRRRRLMTQP